MLLVEVEPHRFDKFAGLAWEQMKSLLLLLPAAVVELVHGSSVQLVVQLMLKGPVQFGSVADLVLCSWVECLHAGCWLEPGLEHWVDQHVEQQGSCVQAGGTAVGCAGQSWRKEHPGEYSDSGAL